MFRIIPTAPSVYVYLVYPLQQSPAPLSSGAVAVHGVLVPLYCLHVREDVGGGLVQGCDLCRGTVRKLYIAEVTLSSLNILSCSYQVVASNTRHSISTNRKILDHPAVFMVFFTHLSSSLLSSIPCNACHLPTASFNCLKP